MRLVHIRLTIIAAVATSLLCHFPQTAKAQALSGRNTYQWRRAGGDPRPLPDGDFSSESELGNSYKYRNRGMFGDRVLGTPVDPGRSQMFQGNGVLRGPSGNFIAIDRDAPNSMFKPYSPTDAELRARSRPAQLQVVAPNARVADTIPINPNRMPPALTSMTGPQIDSMPDMIGQPNWLKPLDGVPGTNPDDIWMRSPDTGSDSMQPGRLQGVGPQGVFPIGETAAAARLYPRLSAQQNQQIASRIANTIVRSPAVRAESPITVTVVDGVATLKGQVTSQQRKIIAGQIAIADPNIHQIRNLLMTPTDQRDAASGRTIINLNNGTTATNSRSVPIANPAPVDPTPLQLDFVKP